MIFEELVSEVCERLNLTSDEAKSRVGREINSRYKRVTTSIGLDVSRQLMVPITLNDSGSADTEHRATGIVSAEKVLAFMDRTSTRDVILQRVTVDELLVLPINTSKPSCWAEYRMSGTNVTVLFDMKLTSPATYSVYANTISKVTTLAGNNAPAFPESFHEILIFGTMADEYRKMEKPSFAKECEDDFERRLSDLRMFLARSAWQQIYQGKLTNDSKYPWMHRGLGPWN